MGACLEAMSDAVP